MIYEIYVNGFLESIINAYSKKEALNKYAKNQGYKNINSMQKSSKWQYCIFKAERFI